MNVGIKRNNIFMQIDKIYSNKYKIKLKIKYTQNCINEVFKMFTVIM